MQAPEPLAAHARMRSRDPGDVRERVGEVFCPHDLQPLRARPQLNARHHVVRLGQTGLNYLTYGADVAIDPGCLQHFYLVQMPLAGEAQIECGGQSLRSDPKVASILNPLDPTRMRWAGDCRQLMLWIPRTALEQRLTEQLGAPLAEPLRFNVALPQQTGLTQAWCRMVHDLARNIDLCGTDWLRFTATVSGLEETLMRGLLQLHQHNYSEQLCRPAPPALPRHVRRAIDYLEAHLEQDIGVTDLARVACVSVRALEEGFRRHCQSSPLQFLRARRLDRIHQLLSQGPSAAAPTVTELAHRYGFIHLGRFAAYYKARFGETPSQTARRGTRLH